MNYDTSNLTRYIESANIDYRLIKKADEGELRESISRVSSHIKESVDNSNDGWWVPISFYEKKNANGRIYGRRLWENVINNQKDIWIGAPMLADHPEGDSDGSPKDICGIWLDAKLDPPDCKGEGLVYGLLIPSGHIGEDLKDHLSKGLKVGTSSSGFGKLLRDGVTVDPDSFVIERLSDWVLNPSQGTFFSYEEDAHGEKEITNKSKPINESVEHKEVKEKFVKDSKIAKLEEKKFRRDMESFLENACNMKDPQERLLEFKEIESYLEDGACPDLRDKIEEKIAEEEEYIRTALKEKAQYEKELRIENPKDLKAKLTKIVEDAAILDKEAKDWKKISENLQTKLTEKNAELEARPTEAYASYLKERNEVLSNNLKNKSAKAKVVINELSNAYKEATSNNANLTSEVTSLQESNKALAAQLEKAEILLKKSSEAFKDLREGTEKLQAQYLDADNKLKNALKENNTAKLACKKLLTENKSLKELNEKENAKIKELKESIDKFSKKEIERRRAFIKENRKQTLTDSEKYFESLKETYGNEILPYKDMITNSITLAEAKRVFFDKVLQNLSETKSIDEARLPESLYVSPEERAKKLGENNFKKANVTERLPKGWY